MTQSAAERYLRLGLQILRSKSSLPQGAGRSHARFVRGPTRRVVRPARGKNLHSALGNGKRRLYRCLQELCTAQQYARAVSLRNTCGSCHECVRGTLRRNLAYILPPPRIGACQVPVRLWLSKIREAGGLGPRTRGHLLRDHTGNRERWITGGWRNFALRQTAFRPGTGSHRQSGNRPTSQRAAPTDSRIYTVTVLSGISRRGNDPGTRSFFISRPQQDC